MTSMTAPVSTAPLHCSTESQAEEAAPTAFQARQVKSAACIKKTIFTY
jgi:hypothetical protein